MTDTIEESEQPQTIGDMIDELRDLKDERKLVNKRGDELGAQIQVVEAKLLAAMDSAGTDISRKDGTSAVATETVVADPEDWEEFYEYVKANDAFYLIQRRINNKPFQELIDSGQSVPGLSVFKKRSISLRKT